MSGAQQTKLSQRLARRLLALFGWRVETEAPAAAKYVMVVYPHTSNWDFPWGYLGKMTLGLKLHWMGKDSLFRWPLGWFFRWLGGIAVDRSRRNNFIEQFSERFRGDERLIIAITPEGTRGRTEYWKSGFYHLARAAQVPLTLAYIDYGNKRMGISEPLWLSGEVEADLERIRAFYADKAGRYPAAAAPIRFAPRDGEGGAATGDSRQTAATLANPPDSGPL